jgi:hypothetical protein
MLNKEGLQPELREEIDLRDKAMAGDMVFVVTPATKSTTARSTAWTRDVIIEVQTAAGEVHTWLDKTITSGVSIADTSTAGTAAIASTTLTLVGGRAKVTVSGNAAAWLATETDTLTVAQASILGYTLVAKTSVETFA